MLCVSYLFKKHKRKKTMKTSQFIPPFAKALFLLTLILLVHSVTNAQNNFKGEKDSPNDDEQKILKEKFKSYQTFQIKPSDIKNALRKSQGNGTQPQKIKLTIGVESLDLNLFENDILADDFVYLENGEVKEKKQKEIVTYAGYVGDNPKNFLRLVISDNRLSGMFKTEKGTFSISHLSDNGIKESNFTTTTKRLVLSNADDEISSLGNSICGNEKNSTGKTNQTNSSSRTATFVPACKYVKVAIATDYEYFLYESSMNGQAGISGLNDKIYDMINKMEFILLNNNQSTYGIPPVGLRLQLSGLVTYTNSNDPFTYTGTDGSGVLSEFTNKVNQGQIFTSNIIRNVSHLLSGRALGFTQSNFTQNQYGQANTSTICSTPSLATSLSTIRRLDNSQILSYTDAWRIAFHEICHTLGASDLTCTASNATIMCPLLGKQPYFIQQSVNEINTYLSNNGSCLNNNIAKPAYSNNFTLKLNGNNIISTPVFVNSFTKTVDIPIDPTLPVTSSTFSSSNSSVTVTKINNNRATFSINSASSFTFNVYAQNSCSFSQWGVPFVFSPSGARISYDTYPNPADDIINLQPESNISLEELRESVDLDKIQLFSEKGILIKEVFDLNSKKINTQDLKNGLYYLHLIDKEGNVEKKRIIINHK